ncbi:MAG TPA: NfeD family protein [Anaerolineales bacterium]|nr:NfeD family protein [Anaerolineales bacterium]
MDFLLDPNIAYLFLLGGVLLAMLALAAPGTGFFEIAALFCISLAGYAIYNLSFNWWALILIALSIIPFVYSIQKPKREIYLGISIFVLVVGSIFFFPSEGGGPAVNPFVALSASALVSGFLWIAVGKTVQAAHARPSHDLEALVGQVGEAKTKIHDEGSVQVAGELWTARSEKPIKAGSPIRVVRREGFVLIVEKQN